MLRESTKNQRLVVLILGILIFICTGTQFSHSNCQDEGEFGTISGRVLDGVTGKGVEGIAVTLNVEDGQVKTDAKGQYKFENLPKAEGYKIRVFIDKEPYCNQIHELDMNLEEGKNIILEGVMAQRGGIIEGNIKKDDGTPVSFLTVKVFVEDEIPGVYAAVPDVYGNYRISRLPPEKDLKVIVSCWNVSHGCGRLVREGIRVKRGFVTKGIDFVVTDDPTGISGKVVSQKGRPLRAHLTFWRDSEHMGSLMSDKRGSYSMRALKPGHYRMHIGYGSERRILSGDLELDVKKTKMKGMDIIISEDSVRYEDQKIQDATGSPAEDQIFAEENIEFSAELLISQNESYSEELEDLILDVYRNDVKPKLKSFCLAEDLQTKVFKRFFNTSKPIIVVIENDQNYSFVKRKRKLSRIEQCGGTLMGSSTVYLYQGALMGKCGSLASILFHELLHVSGFRDDRAYSNTKRCYGDEAIDTPERFIKN